MRATGVAVLMLVALLSDSASAGVCTVVTPNQEIHCPYHRIDGERYNVSYLDLDTGELKAANALLPNDRNGAVILDPFTELGWSPGPQNSVAPDLDRVLVARSAPDCPTAAPGPGLDCSYGRPSLWLAQHAANDPNDPDDDIWVHINLTHRLLGRNSEIHGWTTWLHRDLALFNALVRPDDAGWFTAQEENTAQAYAVRFGPSGTITIEPFGHDALWRDHCLTGRLHAQPSTATDRCFAGQRLTMVRRCYDERPSRTNRAWWNTTRADGSGGPCLAGQAAAEVPVLRTYVVELNADCSPTKPFETLVPVREPPDDPVFRQLGIVPEWGDMLASISPDGRFVAVATSMGDPNGDLTDNCAGFRLNPLNPSDPLSGWATRRLHVCELGSDLRCRGAARRIAAEYSPPETMPQPSFLFRSSDPPILTLLYTRERAVFGQPLQQAVARVDFETAVDAHVPLMFGNHATAISAFYAPTVAATCVGNCNRDGQVTIEDLVMGVNVALGKVQAEACSQGLPSGPNVTIAVLMQAVNNLLTGCDGAG